METLRTSERNLRAAVLEENFEQITAAAREFRDAFDREWRAMPAGLRRRSALPRDADRLMRWAMARVSASRASLAEQRRLSGAASHYLATGRARRERTWGTAG